ncbi:hypothetical protein FRB95_003304 [Tulasnella sp. JGI-2019a]|nr:hypothetical protein FRB95_003304 [Tulasnella sp. JGI-2019a]
MAAPLSGVVSPSLKFRSTTPISRSFAPRIGVLSLERDCAGDATTTSHLELATPGLLTNTSRGVIPHLSWDHVQKTTAIGWVHVPFETFLEQTPPVPTLVPGDRPLHTFLGLQDKRHILSVSLRDPNDAREIPPNGKDYVSAMTVRGKKQVTNSAYHDYATAVKPDIIFALSDILIVPQPPSERRVIKSLERSLRWLAQLLHSTAKPNAKLPNIFVHMAGGIDDVARDDFATGLMEALEGTDARELKPLGLETLEEGVSGFSVDLVPLKHELALTRSSSNTGHDTTQTLIDLVQISLKALPQGKPRLLTGVFSPHEILRFTQIGFDMFDAHFAQRAADWGIALDFRFPCGTKGKGDEETTHREIGVNLYGEQYAMDFGRLAESFRGESSQDQGDEPIPICPCIACSPQFSSNPLLQSTPDTACHVPPTSSSFAPFFTRAYLHHLLHTHEMSAHTMLAAHNLSILSKFLADIRQSIEKEGENTFQSQVEHFHKYYRLPDASGGLFEGAKSRWEDVNLARGKGRLARERAAKENAIVDESGVVTDPKALNQVSMGILGAGNRSGVPLDVVTDWVMGG